MYCWSVKSDGKIEKGVKASVFPTNPPVDGLITNADVETEHASCLDGETLQALIRDDDQAAYAFVLVFLKQKAPEKSDKRWCYIAIDLNEWWPSAPHGDESRLLCYGAGSNALLRCYPGATYIANAARNKIVTVQPDCKPATVDASALNQRIHAVLEASRKNRRDAGQTIVTRL